MSEPVVDSLAIFDFVVIHSENESVQLITAETFALQGNNGACSPYSYFGKCLVIARTHNYGAGQLVRKACEIQPCNKTAHTVTYKNIRQCRVLLFHYHRHTVQIVYKVAPAVLFGEKPRSSFDLTLFP